MRTAGCDITNPFEAEVAQFSSVAAGDETKEEKPQTEDSGSYAYAYDGFDPLCDHDVHGDVKFYRVGLVQGRWHVHTKYGIYQIDDPDGFMRKNNIILCHDGDTSDGEADDNDDLITITFEVMSALTEPFPSALEELIIKVDPRFDHYSIACSSCHENLREDAL